MSAQKTSPEYLFLIEIKLENAFLIVKRVLWTKSIKGSQHNKMLSRNMQMYYATEEDILRVSLPLQYGYPSKRNFYNE